MPSGGSITAITPTRKEQVPGLAGGIATFLTTDWDLVLLPSCWIMPAAQFWSRSHSIEKLCRDIAAGTYWLRRQHIDFRERKNKRAESSFSSASFQGSRCGGCFGPLVSHLCLGHRSTRPWFEFSARQVFSDLRAIFVVSYSFIRP